MNLDDAGRAAADVLPQDVWDFLSGGSGAEMTVAANRVAFDDVFIVPRVLTDVSSCGTSATLLGSRVTMPVGVAPMAYQQLFHPDGELATARAAEVAGVPYEASILSSYSLEEITAVCTQTWFQVYWLRDRILMGDLIDRAENLGCKALALTVDAPRMGRRLRDIRNGFALPSHVAAGNFPRPWTDTARRGTAGSSSSMMHTGEAFDPALTWKDVAWLRGQTHLPIVLKGVLHPDDAVQAIEIGVDAITVSNHGGRQLDGAIGSLTALPAVAAAVEGRAQVLMDSGIRSGADVLKALALGASGVFIGRPVLWGLAADGQRGVDRVLQVMQTELEDALALSGCVDVRRARHLDVLPRSSSAPVSPVQRGSR
ncbi:alpha-hydroxy-acid oxidizing enzyme [Streptomyces colonosanans]|uniref:Alpha-hydroxy-acid oxidizing enzyme n=1 Tax=Streptomyces colonosanans TaxID=1428652 RepID=A0A1S2P2P9_9ACTN|nr:alpha-hydroxy-acid oxidizing enzyme [Streptomyces colonosanans]